MCKPKLTKSLISQFMQIATERLYLCKCLGYVVGIVKGANKSLLLELDDNYYTFPMNWVKDDSSIWRKISGQKYRIDNKTFDTEKETDKFWDVYTSIISSAKQIYI